MANVELLRQTLAQIEAHPEDWNQATWRCDTGMCFAGWTVTLAGRQWAFEANSAHAAFLTMTSDDDENHEHLVKGIPTVYAPATAARLLEINTQTADMLFDGDNDLAQLREFIDIIEVKGHLTEDDFERVVGQSW